MRIGDCSSDVCSSDLNQIEIEIRGDGRGLSPDALVAKAIAARLVTTTEARALGPKEKLELIFRPGFSTAAKITAISGRGVGMDIVKANVEKIGGVVELRNDEGRGLAVLQIGSASGRGRWVQ